MIRISATLLESFRLYLSEDWMEEAELIAHIKGEYVQTPEMRLGKSYHALLERPQRALSGLYEHDGLVFDGNAIDAMLKRIQPNGVFEVKTTKPILIAHPHVEEVRLVAKCDHLAGAVLSEFKTTLDSFDAEKYLASYQWRIMDWLFEPQCITYHVASLKHEEDRIVLKSIDSMNVFRYPAREDDCRELVRRFIEYLHQRQLTEYLREKFPVSVGG